MYNLLKYIYTKVVTVGQGVYCGSEMSVWTTENLNSTGEMFSFTGNHWETQLLQCHNFHPPLQRSRELSAQIIVVAISAPDTNN